MLDSTTAMDDHELSQMRQKRRARVARARGGRRRNAFFESPWSTIVCMLIALGSVIGFSRGVPTWLLLAMGFGGVLIVMVAGYAWRVGSRKQ